MSRKEQSGLIKGVGPGGIPALHRDYEVRLKNEGLQDNKKIGVVGKGAGEMNISTLMDRYLEKNSQFLRPGTIDMTRTGLKHLIKFAGNVPAAELRPEHIRRWQCWFVDSGRSKATANSYVKMTRPAFNWAVKEGLLESSPFEDVRLFRVPQQKLTIYNDKEVVAMLEACPDTKWKALIMLARTSGLRRGECLNLTVSDIDFNTMLVCVNTKKATLHTWAWQPKDYEVRTLPLADTAAQLLADRINELPTGQPYPFLTEKRYKTLLQKHLEGTLLYRQQQTPSEHFSVPFNKIRKRAGVQVGTFHDLRRTWVTMLLRAGMPVHEVKELAGHSDIKTTMTFYAGSCPDTLDRARRAINENFANTMIPHISHHGPVKTAEQIYCHVLPADLIGVTDVLVDENNESDQD